MGVITVLGASPARLTAQSRPLTGIVVDGNDRAVAGARVRVVGGSAAAATDNAGRFRLDVTGGPDVTLSVNALGYRPLTQSVRAGDEPVRLVLTIAPVSLSEMIVTGTAGAVERRSLGNAVSKIDASAVADVAPVRTVAQLLNGRASGVVMTANSGVAGGGVKVSIRGRNSLSLTTQPLVYIDGIRVDNATASGPDPAGGIQGANVVSRLNDINPNDIESIEVIKGPAAATLYGTEASNGVIQIITKAGRAGDRARIGVVVEQGTNAFDDPEGRIPLSYAAGPNGVTAFSLAQSETDRGTPIWRTGHFQRYQLSADGGAATTSYHVASSFTRDQGVDRDNDLNQLSALGTLTFTPRPNFTARANVALTNGRTNLATQEGQGNIFAATQALPALKDTPNRGSLFGPHEVLSEVFDVFQLLRRVTGGVQFNHRVSERLSQRLTLGADFVGENNQVIVQRMTPSQAVFYSAADAQGRKSVRLRDASTTTVDYSASLSLGSASALSTQTTVGAQYFSRFSRFTNTSGLQFPAAGLLTVAGTAIRTGTDDYVENNTAGVFVQQQVGWRNRVFLTGAVRGDDNSAFGENFNFVVYPKVSGSWVINEEGFWRWDFVNTLKLRAAYGAAGQQPDAFAALRTFRPVTGPNNAPTLTTQSIGNPDLKPERGDEFETGFEAGLFNQRVTVDFTYYRQNRRDAILLAPVPPSGGFLGSQYINAGKIRNRGAELQLSAQLISRPRFAWDVTVNTSTNSNKILDLGGQPPVPVGTFPIAQQHAVGYPVAAFFGQRIVSATLGANNTATNLQCVGAPETGGAPVSCDVAPRVYLGRSTPKYEGAVTSTFKLWDRFQLYAMVDFKRGHKRFDTNEWAHCTVFRTCLENAAPERFSPVRLGYVQQGSRLLLIDGFVNDASFAKFRELSVGYEAPASMARRFGASRLALNLAGRNLRTWTNWTGLDPETEQPGTFGELSSSEQANMPLPMQFRLTLNLGF